MTPGSLYRHYKGGEYAIILEATDTETEEEMVVYRSLKDNTIWVRPKTMFLETVEVEGQTVPRFELVVSSQ